MGLYIGGKKSLFLYGSIFFLLQRGKKKNCVK